MTRGKNIIHLLQFVAIALWVGPVSGKTLLVDPAQYGEDIFQKIQSAVDFAGNGDRIEVAAGTYEGGILISGKTVKIIALEGSGSTTLIHTSGPFFVVKDPPAAGTEIEGFTINEAPDGAFELTNAIATVRDIVIQSSVGTALVLEGSETQVKIENVTVGNSVGLSDAPSVLRVGEDSSASLENVRFIGNTGGSGPIAMDSGASMDIIRSWVCENTGMVSGGIVNSGGILSVQSSVFAFNEGETGGAVVSGGLDGAQFENVHFVENTGIAAAIALEEGAAAEVTNGVFVGDGTGTFSVASGDAADLQLSFSAYQQTDDLYVDAAGTSIAYAGGEGIQILSVAGAFKLHPSEDGCIPGAWEPKVNSPLIDAGNPSIQDPFEFPNHLESNLGAYGGSNAMAPVANSDEDSYPDLLDNCPYVENEFQDDADGDGEGDVCDPTSGIDLDNDSDGILDSVDNCPYIQNSDQADFNGDGKGDVCDQDDDSDGTPDPQDCFPKDPEKFPGALEVCNGIDDDCNGTPDDGILCGDAIEEAQQERLNTGSEEEWAASGTDAPTTDVVPGSVPEAPPEEGCRAHSTHPSPLWSLFAGVLGFLSIRRKSWNTH